VQCTQWAKIGFFEHRNSVGPASFFSKKNPGYPIFVKIQYMQQTKNARGIWWLVFFASTAALALAIYTHWEWLTLILPFQTTAFVKAMDIM
jgi:hypothetical protein